ncbi:little elongation complex subunit 2 isoform X2 [Triplophysa dalaica]|uniref:little elongation complex subunit 2 isoform X2 n=1 Tax=Triplophysa dalaica TaxID=1582913 RepID=UPI0024DFEC91|nr:little elongation complex subunit 2 isoform X2 [Triplophysa dalaica]
MELKWTDGPVTGPVVFSRDVFDKFTLAPTIKELYALVQSHDPDGSSSESKSAKCVREDSQNGSSTSHASVEPPDSRQTQNNVEPNRVRIVKKPFPEPLVPYTSFTALNVKERNSHLSRLKNKNYRRAPKHMPERISNEITEFMKYLQNVSRACADGYNYVPPGGNRYIEEYFTVCLEHIKSYPQLYSIQEITGLTTAKFVCELSLNFEKQLLALGKIDMVDQKILPENSQLAGDYETVSSVTPPAKKASSLHTPISSDNNAEKLSATYEPHVCLSKEAFLQLLSNDPEFNEAWELPFWIKTNATRGSGQSKTAYIDPPLLKTEMSWRERNLMFHEESVKVALKNTVSRQNPVFLLASEDLSLETDRPPEETISRSVVAFDDAGMDFEADLTDLESFGGSCKTNVKVKAQKEAKTAAGPSNVISSPKKPTDALDITKDNPKSTPSEIQEEADGEGCALDLSVASEEEHLRGGSKEKIDKLSHVQGPPTKRSRRMMNQESDSDDERLVIDQIASPQRPQTSTQLNLATSTPANPLGKGMRKCPKRQRISGECDQLGQILKMQDAMMKPTPSKIQEPQKAAVLEDKPPEHKMYSMVKPCVTSYLESREGQGEDPTLSTVVPVHATRKRLLKEDLQIRAEDEVDFDPPAEGSVLYKLYSLHDILLMVRSSVLIAHPRHDRETFRAVPLHVLPKLEYQLCYGAESLTHSEVCQLWAEKLLHSSAVSFISRINAHTSEVAEIQELEADWIQNITCNFNPARCLNILYHLLKKVSTLQEGRYLLVHKPREGFVTIFKATDGNKAARGVYNLQAVHCGPPAVASVLPWVPLDPWHILPFHQQHNRPPCTFPPRPPLQVT